MANTCASGISNHFEPGPRREEVLLNHAIAGDIWQLDVSWSGGAVAAGQFVNLLPPGGGLMPLRRPISVANYDASARRMSLLYRVVGRGTAALATLQTGMNVDLLGPLGHGFPISKPAAAVEPHAVLIGGGVGIPPLYLLGRHLAAAGWTVEFQLGIRSANQLFWAEQFRALGDLQLASDDGSIGVAGTVAQLWDVAASSRDVDAVYSCGPLPMLRAVKEHWAGTVPTYLSLEERMACGTGACYACVVHASEADSKQYRICFDGPVFAAEKVAI